jgi:hypothetical protein
MEPSETKSKPHSECWLVRFGFGPTNSETRHEGAKSYPNVQPCASQIVLLLAWFQQQAASQAKGSTGAGVRNYLVHADWNRSDFFTRLISHSLSFSASSFFFTWTNWKTVRFEFITAVTVRFLPLLGSDAVWFGGNTTTVERKTLLPPSIYESSTEHGGSIFLRNS